MRKKVTISISQHNAFFMFARCFQIAKSESSLTEHTACTSLNRPAFPTTTELIITKSGILTWVSQRQGEWDNTFNWIYSNTACLSITTFKVTECLEFSFSLQTEISASFLFNYWQRQHLLICWWSSQQEWVLAGYMWSQVIMETSRLMIGQNTLLKQSQRKIYYYIQN